MNRSILLCSLLLAGCLLDDTISANRAPAANAGKAQMHDYEGEPVLVQLDGSKSKDPDGKIETYRWRSADFPLDGGPDAAAIEPPNPRDEVKPNLELEPGVWRFALWVQDDDGAVSEPDYVTINIGNDPVAQCVEDSVRAVPEACIACSCGVSDECRTAITDCREDCWMLIECVAANCPDSDVACIVMNCGTVLGAQSTQDSATAAGPCVVECVDACSGGASDADAGT